MTLTDAIMHFAVNHAVPFKKQELLNSLQSDTKKVSDTSIMVLLNRLVAKGKLIRIKNGLYSLPSDFKYDFIYKLNDETSQLNRHIKEAFPFITYCVWQPAVFIPFMQHVPRTRLTLVDVERVAMESVFLSLHGANLSIPVLLSPSAKECERYITNDELIIVRPLIQEAPITIMNGYPVPTMEKMLVDAISDKELQFVQGAELYSIFNNVFAEYKINESRLLRYASRRNRKDKIEQILKSLKL